jgi:hypothetical protein
MPPLSRYSSTDVLEAVTYLLVDDSPSSCVTLGFTTTRGEHQVPSLNKAGVIRHEYTHLTKWQNRKRYCNDNNERCSIGLLWPHLKWLATSGIWVRRTKMASFDFGNVTENDLQRNHLRFWRKGIDIWTLTNTQAKWLGAVVSSETYHIISGVRPFMFRNMQQPCIFYLLVRRDERATRKVIMCFQLVDNHVHEDPRRP